MSTYKVVLTGGILPGHELEQVKHQISTTFNLSEDSEHLQLMLGGKPLVVKAGVSHDQAQAYHKAIVEAGLECNIVSEASAGANASDDGQQAHSTMDGETDEIDMPEPRKLSAGSGWNWIKEGFHYFKQKPVIWIGMIIVYMLLSIALSLIPFVSLVQNLILPVFTGGLMLACYKLYQGETISIGDLFGGFRKNTVTLIKVGAAYMLGTILLVAAVMAAVFTIIGGNAMAQLAQSTQVVGPPPPAILLAALAFLALLIPLIMSYYFAPALVVMHDMPALKAMKLSFKGCLRNMVPFLVYGVVTMILMTIAIIPLGLGMLVMVPVLIASTFAAYRQIYTDTASP